jgi:hypothetical protein
VHRTGVGSCPMVGFGISGLVIREMLGILGNPVH